MRPLLLAVLLFVAGYITARLSFVSRLLELACFAWDHGVVGRLVKAFAIISVFFFLFIIPVERIATREVELVRKGAFPKKKSFVDRALESPTIIKHNISARTITAKGKFLLMGAHGVMRIFWPYDTPRDDSVGLILGWRNSSMDAFVVTVLHDVDNAGVEYALKTGTLFRKSHHSLERIFELCGRSSLHVLGRVNDNYTSGLDPEYIYVRTTKRCPYPIVLAPQGSSVNVQVVMYDRPNPRQMQYLSLQPISLALTDTSTFVTVDDSAEEARERARKASLVQKLKLHSVHRRPLNQKEESLGRIINQMNCASDVRSLLQENVVFIGRARRRRGLSVSERVVESANSLWRIALKLMLDFIMFCMPYIIRAFVAVVLSFRFFADLILRVLEWRLKPEWAALKDISATAQQFDIRLQQFCYWPMQYTTLRKRRKDWDSVTTSHPDYIRFYNSLWLVANDIIIGMALGSYIVDNAYLVAKTIDHYLIVYSVDGLQRMIHWLMQWPAGLKLNTELARFLGDLFLWVINYWAGCIISLRPYLPRLIYLIGMSSFAGATMPIALFSDLLSVLTLHIYSFYIASARIYNWQLTIIISLFHLFRGKKRNVLRNRIDSCDYDLDQLLVGTILFTLLFFLLPTVLVFYLTFASARMAIIIFKAALETMLACLNHFPLFALMLRLKDSKRLPGGIRFDLMDSQKILANFEKLNKQDEGMELAETSYIQLNPIPLGFTAMFHQYFQLGGRIRKHYASPKVIFCLVTGQFVPPIHRKNLYSLQYSMLPTKREGIVRLWYLLTEEEDDIQARTLKKSKTI